MDSEQAQRRVGSTLRGKWQLVRLVGVGGMAAVYEAHHRIGRVDAIKILHPSVAANPSLRSRFEQEAHAANRLRHPGAVEVRDVDVTDDGAPFLVMEMVEGETLSDRFRSRGAPPPDEVLRWADELLDVLAAAHDQGIVHRDVKPDNLLLTPSGALKVLDFGIARMATRPAAGVHTRGGVALGTLSYMSPEQIRGGDVDGRADLFSVGATMFRLLTGRRLHEASSDAELVRKLATEPAPGLATVAPQLPPFVCSIVDRALALDRERRYPDARTMQLDVRAARGAQPPPFAAAPSTEAGAAWAMESTIAPGGDGRGGPATASLVSQGLVTPVMAERPPAIAEVHTRREPAIGLEATTRPESPRRHEGPTVASPVHAPISEPTRTDAIVSSAPPFQPAPFAPSPEAEAEAEAPPRPLPKWLWAVVLLAVLVGGMVVVFAIFVALATARVVNDGHPGEVFYGLAAIIAIVGMALIAAGLMLARRIG